MIEFFWLLASLTIYYLIEVLKTFYYYYNVPYSRKSLKLMTLKIILHKNTSHYSGRGSTRDDDDNNNYLRLNGYNALKPPEKYKIILS